jgi:hypothetical protein
VVNHSAPSGPFVMIDGRLCSSPRSYVVTWPPVVRRAICPRWISVTHSASSGPATMLYAPAPTGNSSIYVTTSTP